MFYSLYYPCFLLLANLLLNYIPNYKFKNHLKKKKESFVVYGFSIVIFKKTYFKELCKKRSQALKILISEM